MIGVRLGVGHHFSGGFDSSASAFFAATGITGTTEQQAVNTLVTSLKSAGLWSKMKAVYPFVTDNRNLLSYTQAFDNSAWAKTSITVVADSTTAPDATTTADTIQNQANGAYIRQPGVALSNTTYTQSCYFKKNNNNWVAMYTSDGGSNYAIAYFNINTGVVGTASAVGNFSNVSSSISSASNGYYRCVLTFTKPSSASSETSIIVPDADNTFNRTAGQNVYAWGAQLELGSTATTYQPIATTQQSYISNQFKYNLVNPVDSDAAFRGVFNGGWTFSNQGALPNGTNGYMDTKFVPNSNWSTSSQHISFYSRSNLNGGYSIGAYGDGSLSETALIIKYSNGRAYLGLGTGALVSVNNADGTGFYVAKRTTNSTATMFRNNNLLLTNSNVNLALNTISLYLGAVHANTTVADYDNKQCAFSSIGDGLNDTEATALYNAVQTFNTSLSRQV